MLTACECATVFCCVCSCVGSWIYLDTISVLMFDVGLRVRVYNERRTRADLIFGDARFRMPVQINRIRVRVILDVMFEHCIVCVRLRSLDALVLLSMLGRCVLPGLRPHRKFPPGSGSLSHAQCVIGCACGNCAIKFGIGHTVGTNQLNR